MSRTDGYLVEVSEIASKLDRAAIDKAIRLLFEAWKSDQQIFLIGNGGSASTATHFACDLNKWCSDDAERRIKAPQLLHIIQTVSELDQNNCYVFRYDQELIKFHTKEDDL
ncbi:MAG: SIS domain-containing protein, partial [Nitrososphaerota archaeon]|nr:SIS domain-containing protein [Nitrososphaerota archaeon]